MNTALRWIIATVGWLALLIVYVIWKDIEKFTGGGGFVTGFLRGAIVFGGAYYLYKWAKSVAPARSQDTYGSAVPAISNSPQNVPLESYSTMPQQTAVDENHIYAEIANELETRTQDKGLWTRLYAECNGDENKTKVLYIKQRAEHLITTERTRLAQLEHQQAANAEQLKRLKHQRSGLADPELVCAVWNGNWNTASKLLRDGIKPIGTDPDGNSLLDLARKRRDQQMIQLLESYGAH